MSTQTIRPRNTRLILPAIVAGVLAVVAGIFVFRPAPTTTTKTADQTLSVPVGEAGKAGDLVITQEAMELAAIKVAPVTARLVSEKLEVSGVVQAGGDDLVKITPRVAGKIVKLYSGVGDTVRAGQTLALLESADLGQAQAAYRQAVARVSAATSFAARAPKLSMQSSRGAALAYDQC